MHSGSALPGTSLLLALGLWLSVPLFAAAQATVPPPHVEPSVLGANSLCCPEPSGCQRPLSVRVIPYGWLTEMEGDLTLRGVTADVDVGLDDTWDFLWNDLNFAALGQIEAYSGPFGVIFNGLYMDMSLGAQVRRLDFDADFTQTILDTVFTYELQGVAENLSLPCGSRLDLLAGMRYNSLSAGVTITGPRGNSVRVAGSEDWLDLIVGGRLRVPLNEITTFSFRGDVGGFDIGNSSEFTWNIELMFERRWSERCSLFAGYRWLGIDRDDAPRFGYDMTISGPIMGIVLDF